MSGKQIKPIYYFCGADDYRIEEAVRSIREEVLTGGFESMNLHTFEGKGLDPGALVAACSTMPAFAEKRLVIVTGAGAIKADEARALLGYVEDPSPTTCLVFVAGGEKPAKGEKAGVLYKALDNLGFVTVYDRLSERELVGWVVKEAKRQGKAITPAAASKLVLIAGTRLRDVKGELDKVVLFAGDKPGIDETDVEDSGLDCREETIFALSDAIGARDVKKAFAVYGMVSDKEPVMVLGSIARQIRMLISAKSLILKGTPSNAFAARLGVYPKYADDYARRSRLFTMGELTRAMSALFAADTEL